MSKTIVCACEDVELAEVFSALRQGFTDIESLKRYTGIGTGKCQGKCCLVQTLRLLDSPQGDRAIQDGRGAGPGELLSGSDEGTAERLIRIPTIRQPVTPLTINELIEAENNEDRS